MKTESLMWIRAHLIFGRLSAALNIAAQTFNPNSSWIGLAGRTRQIPFLFFCLHLSAVNQAEVVIKMGSKK
jgi:hypothetical protein